MSYEGMTHHAKHDGHNIRIGFLQATLLTYFTAVLSAEPARQTGANPYKPLTSNYCRER